MSSYQVDSELIATATAGVHRSMTAISAEATALMHQLTALQGSWRGAAANAFTGVAAGWQATHKQVEASLAAINQALAATGQTYAQAERSAMAMFAGR